MDKKLDSNFALKAILAVTIVLGLLMTYSIYLRNKPAGFSLLYFDQGNYTQGDYVVVLENRENSAMNYTLSFIVDGQKTGELSVYLQDGQKASYAVIEQAPEFAVPDSTVEVRATRSNKEPLTIYATNRQANQKG